MKLKSVLLATFSTLLFLSFSVHAAEVTLRWDKPIDTRVTGYHIYCGKSGTNFQTTPHTKINSVDTTTCVIPGLESGVEYSFTATSFDANGNESVHTATVRHLIKLPEDIDNDGDGYTENQGDSNDADSAIHPDAEEICGDGVDQDCNGSDLPCPDPNAKTMVFGNSPDAHLSGTVQDTYLNIDANVNATSATLNTYTWPVNTPANSVLIRFDLSGLPAGALIQNAALKLYQTAAGGDAAYDVSAHRIINHKPDLNSACGYTYDGVNNWTANTIAYNGIPLAQADIAPADDVNSLDQSLGVKTWNITGMVQQWANNADANYGLMINSDPVASANSYRTFAACEASDATRRPRLEITYSLNGAIDVDKDNDGHTKADGDCNDDDASIYPGAPEICGDGIDQDCNGNDLICPENIDNDGDGYTENEGDCNDGNPAIHPGASDICGDGIDQDCNGSDLTCPEDLDKDGDGYSQKQGDCNDNSATIHSGASDICGDGIDQDCNGSDPTCPEDLDNDGDGYSQNQGDCNDNSATIHRGAEDICDDGIDQDCNGADLECGSEPLTVVFGDSPDADFPGTVTDTFININQDLNVAKDTLTTYTWPANMPANAVLFKFDLSRLPVDARIESATLSLYQTAAGGDAAYDVSVHKIINVDPDLNYANGYAYDHANEWTPSTSCYNSIPLAQSDVASALEVVSLDRSLGQKNWNVTAMAQEWVDNPSTNFGLMLNSDAVAGANSYRTFAASEAIDAASRPRLEITYSINSNDRNQDGDGYTPNQGDCNDNDATVYPGAEEICEDGIDQDCSGSDAICSAEPLTVVFGDSLNTDYPGTIYDTFININNDVKVAAQVLNTYTWPANMPANAVLIKFNLSQLPADAQIQSAMLRLYQTSAGGDATYDVSAHKIINVNPDLEYATGYAFDYAGEWTANDTCYDSIPLAQSDIAPAEDVKSLDPKSGYKEWTLTGMVREWLVHPSTNFGVMLNSDKVANANSFRSFQASESTQADQRPELIVTYTERQ